MYSYQSGSLQSGGGGERGRESGVGGSERNGGFCQNHPYPPPPHLQFIPLKCPSLFRLSQLMTSSKYCEKFVSVFTMRHIAVNLLVFFFTCITSLSCEAAFQPPASLQWPENEHLSLCLRLSLPLRLVCIYSYTYCDNSGHMCDCYFI